MLVNIKGAVARPKGDELIGDAFEIKPEVHLRLDVNRYMEVDIHVIYRCDPFPFPEGSTYRFWGLNLEFWYGQEFVE